MNEWEIKNIQRQLDRLDNTVLKQSTTNFIWLMILSNILFWFCIAHIALRHDANVAGSLKQHSQTVCDAEQNVTHDKNIK